MMIEIKNKDRTNIAGYLQQWHFKGIWGGGIRVEDDLNLDYVNFIGKIQGIHLGPISPYGMAEQGKMYDQNSYLFNGTILTYGIRREYLGRKDSKSDLPKIKVSEDMPEKIVTITGETVEKVLETAIKLKLPLEEVVLAH